MEYQDTTIAELEESLNKGIVKFAFKKVGGSLRIALGTTSLSQIPNAKHPTKKSNVPSTLPYFDIEKGAWRCMNRNQDFYIVP